MNKKTKKEAQKELDRIAYWLGVRNILGASCWMLLSIIIIVASLHLKNLFLQVAVFMLSAIPIMLWLRWQKCQKVKKTCPRCGAKLEIVRSSFNFTDIVIKCPSCKLESDRSQDWEGTPS
jgi:DNA replicative helicase MCM subunit Mcm2 (Cdc46/Mcm family)